MKDITIISTAIADYITDNGIAPTQDGLYTSGDAFYLSLFPKVLSKLKGDASFWCIALFFTKEAECGSI